MVESQPQDKEWDKKFLTNVVKSAITHIEIKDRKYHFTNYPKCFLGNELAAFFVAEKYVRSVEEAVLLG